MNDLPSTAALMPGKTQQTVFIGLYPLTTRPALWTNGLASAHIV
jgi:hypothetical protein